MNRYNNDLGALGEDLVSACLRRATGYQHRILFRPQHLGEKCELLDYLVFLIDDNGHAFGPHFFLQVKTTAVPHRTGTRSIATSFHADRVARTLDWKTPCYLAVVDASIQRLENIYVVGLSSTSPRGVYRIPTSQSLNDPAIRKTLFDEVKAHFENRTFHFISSLTSAGNKNTF